ncbi:hypothetical protein WCD74_00455 [Actinomycetospora sp. OC33-EN08]|uniref:Uncharacterized protein n=1 Tax=Actinomycetospora aurantiaca TaxID=3129233 RepID=A0ABU8MHV3_9PSEU
MGRPVMELEFEGALDVHRLAHLQKLLDLESYARLDDAMDHEFGHRRLHDGGGLRPRRAGLPSVVLYGDETREHWRIVVDGGSGSLPAEVVDRVRREAEAAARAVGLTRVGSGPDDPAPSAAAMLPERPVLTVRLFRGDGLEMPFPSSRLSTISTALGLRPESGFEGESGWRHVHRDEGRRTLLQAWSEDSVVHTVRVLVDHTGMDPREIEGLRLQILAAARLGHQPVRDILPPVTSPASRWRYGTIQETAWGPPVRPDTGDEPSAEQLLAMGDATDRPRTLAGLLWRFDLEDAPYELVRGVVLTAVSGLVHDAVDRVSHGMYGILPRDGVLDDDLREQVLDLLLGRTSQA